MAISRIIDVSHWDSQCDWDKVKSSGIDGVYIKCTDGIGFIDPMCLNHATGAKGSGLAVGYYHFAEPDVNASAQAIFFAGQLAKLPQSDLMPVLDIEKDTTANVQLWINTFMASFKTPMMLYSYQPYLDAHSVQFECPLWLACYRSSYTMPKGWSQAAMWQFTNTSIVDGVPVKVDENKVLTQDFVYYQ